MSVIYKYPLVLKEDQRLNLPKGAVFLSAHASEYTSKGHGTINTWYLLPEPGAEKEWRTIRIIGTGNPIQQPVDRLVPMATVQMPPFVWHLFEEV